MFHDQIVSKNCDNLITLEHHKELSLLLAYEEMKRTTEGIPKFNLDRFLDFDLEEIFMYRVVSCIENPYIANYIKTKDKYKMKRILMKGKRLPNILLLFLMMNQVTRRSLLFNQSH